jgi:signal transduction histidine kinase
LTRLEDDAELLRNRLRRRYAVGHRQGRVLREIEALRVEVKELRASRARLAVTNDADRRSIERALHDGVQQQLVGLAANLELAFGALDVDPAEAKRLLTDMGRDAQAAMDETRRLAERIYPPLLESGGMRVALRSAAAGARVPIRIEIAGDATYPPEIAGAMFFCCLDVLERAAAGTTAMVTLRNEAGTLAFEIVTEGEVDLDPLPMRDRIEALGGRLTVGGSDKGTRVAGSLPISR